MSAQLFDLPIPFTRAFAMRGSGRLFARLAKGRAMENLLSLAIAGARRQIVLSRLRNAANAAARTVGDATSDGRPETISSASKNTRSASARDKTPFSTKRRIKD
jgi:hypothetical protein